MGVSVWQILIVLLIVVLIFGTKKLRNMGGDLGGALKGFKNAMKEDEPNNKGLNKDADFEEVEDKTANTSAKVESSDVSDKQQGVTKD